MDSVVSQIKHLMQTADEAGRLNISKTLQQVQSEFVSPKEVLHSIANLHLLPAVVRVGADLNLYGTLCKHQGCMSVNDLAKSSGASPQLLERVLRYLASNDIIHEVGEDRYEANKTTHAIADSAGDGMIHYGFDVHGRIAQALPAFLAETNYQDVTCVTKTPFQKAFNTELAAFNWLVQRPELFASLQKIMTSMKSADWTTGFDLIDQEAQKVSSGPAESFTKPFFVDVGGGYGHQCIMLAKKYPNLLGHLVLQDLPEAVKKLPQIEGVKAEAYDFFEKQPITGAKFYYMRRIMHDWCDNDASKILQNVAASMGPDSRILIDEVVLPRTGAHWQATMADIAMMAASAGKERSMSQWNALCGRSGLRVEQIHTYEPVAYTSILVLVSQ
jgi:demethylsterigmatocystin 6-O-methyltransferase